MAQEVEPTFRETVSRQGFLRSREDDRSLKVSELSIMAREINRLAYELKPSQKSDI
jgi:hypothetical protein